MVRAGPTRRREETIRKLLGRSEGERLKMGDVEEVALDLGVSRATLYRLITAYRQTPTVEALEPRQRGRMATAAKEAVSTVRRLRPACPAFFLRRFDELAAAALGERNDFSI